MNILLAGNDAYAFGTKVMLTSLLENRSDDEVTIYFTYNQLSDVHKEEYSNLVNKYNHCAIHFIFIPLELFHDVPLKATTNPYITVETYFRMAMCETLPFSVDRILYLDTDIIVNRGWSEFYHTKFKDEIAAVACQDYGLCIADKIRKKVYENINFDLNDPYFNAGVMLINLKYVREHYSLSLFKQYISDHYESLIFHDQDVLNSTFKNHIQYMDFNLYNCRPFFYPYNKKSAKIIREAVFIHYGEKPWNIDFTDIKGAGELFWEYALKMGADEEYYKWKKLNHYYKFKNLFKIAKERLKRNIKLIMLVRP